MRIILFLISFLILLCYSNTSHSQGSEYKIVNKFHIEGDEGWDALTVDESTGRIFISHGSMVQAIDEVSGNVTGTISGLMRVHGIAIASDVNKGFISNGGDSSVTVFDLNTLSSTDKINMTGRN